MTNPIIPDFPHIPASTLSLAMRKLVFGVGINDAPYIITQIVDGKQVICPFYVVWKSMLQRVYSPKYHANRPTYTGCTVYDEWLYFMTFRVWMEKQDWQGKQIDKDLLVPGNKIYSPDRCMFVSPQINSLLNDCGSARGDYPCGVCVEGGKYRAQICRGSGKQDRLGLFDTPEAASAVYKRAKSTYVRKVAAEQSEPLRSALYMHSMLLEGGMHES